MHEGSGVRDRETNDRSNISSHKPFILFSPPCSAEEGSDSTAPGTQPGSTHRAGGDT